MSHSENMMIQWHCITCHTVMSCAYCGAAMHITQLHHMHAAPLQICHTGISHAHVANVICVSPYQMCIQSHCNTCHTVTSDAYVTHRHDTCIQHHCNVCHTNIACMQHYSKPCVTQRYHMLQCHCHKVILHAYSAREICIT